MINLLKPSARNYIYVSSLSEVEVVAAIARRRKGLRLSQNKADKSIVRFEKGFERRFLIVEATVDVLKRAVRLADSHSLRGYDAVHLASALEANAMRRLSKLSPLIFVSADNELNSAALAEGLQIENPNNYP